MNRTLYKFVFSLIVFSSGIGWNSSFGSSVKEDSPYLFTENQGQWNTNANFLCELRGGFLFFEDNTLTYNLYKKDIEHGCSSPNHGKAGLINWHAFKVHFNNSNPSPKTTGLNKKDYNRNYFKGSDPNKWASNVPVYSGIKYSSLYDNIDLQYFGEGQSLKYEFVVQPGGNPSEILMEFEGVNGLSIKNGSLIVSTSIGEISDSKPYVYQVLNGKKKQIKCHFSLENEKVGFSFPKGFDSSIPLIIDPTLIFATFSGSVSDNWGYTATYDEEGNHYAGGTVFGASYPITTGAYETQFQGGVYDIAITKFNPTGTNQIYSTFLGGNSDEQPHSLIVNSQDQLIVLGTTNSSDYPATSGYDLSHNGGNDIILSMLSPDGSNLLHSTFIGGSGEDGINIGPVASTNSLVTNYGDNNRGEVMIDLVDNIYVGSCTQSSDFPVTSGAFQMQNEGSQDGCLFKLNPTLSSLTWSTYIGGNNDDACYSLAVDSSQQVYATGGTRSGDFPTVLGAYQFAYGGNIDGFIVKLSQDGSSLVNSTFIGTGAYDQSYFIQIDDDIDVYVVGQTSGNFPITPGVFSNPSSSQFIAKFDNNLSTRIYSTVFGSGSSLPNISPTAFMVDICEYVYVSGWGGDANSSYSGGNTYNMPITYDAFQSNTDGSDLYFLVLDKDAENLVFGSYYGGDGLREHVDGGTCRFDKNAVIYQAVCAGCGGSSGFPTTPGAFSNSNNSGNCNLGAMKIEFPLPGIISEFDFDPIEPVCRPSEINFENTSSGGLGFFWDFGDGNTSTQYEPTHIFTSEGTYTTMLISSDPNSCNKFDTTYKNIVVLPGPTASVSPDMELCPGESATLIAGGGVDYLWFPSEGLSDSTSPSPVATIENPTDYSVIVTNIDGCSDTATVSIDFYPENPVEITTPDTLICPGDTISLHSTGNGNISWSPGSEIINPNSFFPEIFPSQPQNWIASLTDVNNCTLTDTVFVDISEIFAEAGPVQNVCIGDSGQLEGSGLGTFQWTPIPPLANPNVFDPSAYSDTSLIFYLTVIDQYGCTAIDSTEYNIIPLPVIEAGLDTQLCLMDFIQLHASGADTYLWSPVMGISDSASANPIASPTSLTQYFVEGTDGFGCRGLDSVWVDVLPLPPSEATGETLICPFDTTQLHGWGTGSLAWVPATNISDPLSPDPFVFPLTTTDYILEILGDNGCYGRDTVTIEVSTINSSPGPDEEICIGDSVQLAAYIGLGYSYLWEPNQNITPQGSPTPFVFPTSDETYTLYVEDQYGCKDTNSLEIIVHELPTILAEKDTSICAGESTTLSVSGAISYEWTPINNLSDPFFPTTQAFPDTSVMVMVTGTDGNGCQNMDSVFIEVRPLPIPNIQAFPDTICTDSSTQLTAEGGGSYLWSPAGYLNDHTISNPLATLDESTQFTVEVTGQNECRKKDSILIRVTPTPVILTSPSDSICVGTQYVLWAESPGLNIWSTGDTVDTLVVSPQQTTEYTVYGEGEGCNTREVAILIEVVHEVPVADFEVTPDSGWVPLSVEFINQSIGAVNYEWDFGNGFVSDSFQQSHFYPDTGKFMVDLVGINRYGCKDTITKPVTVRFAFEIWIPNAFSPNSDGTNEYWTIPNIGTIDFELSIYDRWGKLIFNTTDPNFKWDGHFRNLPLPEGVYAYTFVAGNYYGRQVLRSGTVTLIR